MPNCACDSTSPSEFPQPVSASSPRKSPRQLPHADDKPPGFLLYVTFSSRHSSRPHGRTPSLAQPQCQPILCASPAPYCTLTNWPDDPYAYVTAPVEQSPPVQYLRRPSCCSPTQLEHHAADRVPSASSPHRITWCLPSSSATLSYGQLVVPTSNPST